MTMRSRVRGYRWLALALGLLAPTAARAADVEEVLARMRAAVEPATDMRADFEMELKNKQGESAHWTGQYFRKPGAAGGIRLVFDAPLDLRGTEVTARADQGHEHLRVYLPALRRVRDISGDMRGESFLGTDFNYEDLGLGRLETWQNTLLDDGKDDDGRSCYRLESRPTRGWWYGRVVRCVDKKTYLPVKTEYFDRSEVLWKVRTLGRMEKIAGRATPTRITMATVPTGTITVIMLRNVSYDAALPASMFEGP